MGEIWSGSNKIKEIWTGGQKIREVWSGNNKVWSASPNNATIDSITSILWGNGLITNSETSYVSILHIYKKDDSTLRVLCTEALSSKVNYKIVDVNIATGTFNTVADTTINGSYSDTNFYMPDGDRTMNNSRYSFLVFKSSYITLSYDNYSIKYYLYDAVEGTITYIGYLPSQDGSPSGSCPYSYSQSFRKGKLLLAFYYEQYIYAIVYDIETKQIYKDKTSLIQTSSSMTLGITWINDNRFALLYKSITEDSNGCYMSSYATFSVTSSAITLLKTENISEFDSIFAINTDAEGDVYATITRMKISILGDDTFVIVASRSVASSFGTSKQGIHILPVKFSSDGTMTKGTNLFLSQSATSYYSYLADFKVLSDYLIFTCYSYYRTIIKIEDMEATAIINEKGAEDLGIDKKMGVDEEDLKMYTLAYDISYPNNAQYTYLKTINFKEV